VSYFAVNFPEEPCRGGQGNGHLPFPTCHPKGEKGDAGNVAVKKPAGNSSSEQPRPSSGAVYSMRVHDFARFGFTEELFPGQDIADD
jgi:hypothetical protein